MKDTNLVDRLADLAERARRLDFVTHTAFLTPAECAEAAAWMKKNQVLHLFSGGYPEAERRVAFLLPFSSREGDENADGISSIVADTITALTVEVPSRAPSPGHRDYLGSLLSLGIRRDQTGDIAVRDHGATLLLLSSASGIVLSQLTKIGGQNIRILPCDLSSVQASSEEGTKIRVTVSSLRLDKIAACGFSLGRQEAADRIASGDVRVNWREETRPDARIELGTVISLRGLGRVRLVSEEGLSRKDRHILILERFH